MNTCGQTHLVPLVLEELIITKSKSVVPAKFGFAEAFPKIHAYRAARRSEIRKDEIVSDNYRSDHRNGAEQNRRTQLRFYSPRGSHECKQSNGPTDTQVQWIHTK